MIPIVPIHAIESTESDDDENGEQVETEAEINQVRPPTTPHTSTGMNSPAIVREVRPTTSSEPNRSAPVTPTAAELFTATRRPNERAFGSAPLFPTAPEYNHPQRTQQEERRRLSSQSATSFERINSAPMQASHSHPREGIQRQRMRSREREKAYYEDYMRRKQVEYFENRAREQQAQSQRANASPRDRSRSRTRRGAESMGNRDGSRDRWQGEMPKTRNYSSNESEYSEGSEAQLSSEPDNFEDLVRHIVRGVHLSMQLNHDDPKERKDSRRLLHANTNSAIIKKVVEKEREMAMKPVQFLIDEIHGNNFDDSDDIPWGTLKIATGPKATDENATRHYHNTSTSLSRRYEKYTSEHKDFKYLLADVLKASRMGPLSRDHITSLVEQQTRGPLRQNVQAKFNNTDIPLSEALSSLAFRYGKPESSLEVIGKFMSAQITPKNVIKDCRKIADLARESFPELSEEELDQKVFEQIWARLPTKPKNILLLAENKRRQANKGKGTKLPPLTVDAIINILSRDDSHNYIQENTHQVKSYAEEENSEDEDASPKKKPKKSKNGKGKSAESSQEVGSHLISCEIKAATDALKQVQDQLMTTAQVAIHKVKEEEVKQRAPQGALELAEGLKEIMNTLDKVKEAVNENGKLVQEVASDQKKENKKGPKEPRQDPTQMMWTPNPTLSQYSAITAPIFAALAQAATPSTPTNVFPTPEVRKSYNTFQGGNQGHGLTKDPYQRASTPGPTSYDFSGRPQGYQRSMEQPTPLMMGPTLEELGLEIKGVSPKTRLPLPSPSKFPNGSSNFFIIRESDDLATQLGRNEEFVAHIFKSVRVKQPSVPEGQGIPYIRSARGQLIVSAQEASPIPLRTPFYRFAAGKSITPTIELAHILERACLRCGYQNCSVYDSRCFYANEPLSLIVCRKCRAGTHSVESCNTEVASEALLRKN